MEETINNAQAQEASPVFDMNSEGNEIVPAAEKVTFWKKNRKKLILLAVVAIIVLSAGILFRVTRADYVACQYAKASTLGNEMRVGKLSALNPEEELLYWYALGECYEDYYDESTSYRKKVSIDDYLAENLGKYDAFEFYAAKSDEYDQDIENWSQLCKAYRQEKEDNLEERFGSYKVSAEKRSTKQVRPSSFDELDIQAFEKLGLDWENIGKIKGVTVRVKIDGEYDRGSFNRIVYLIRSGIGWKVIDSESLD